MTRSKRILALGILIVFGLSIVAVAEAAPRTRAPEARFAAGADKLHKAAKDRVRAAKNPEAIAQRIADMAGVPKDSVLTLKQSGLTWPEVMDKVGLTFKKVADYRTRQRDAAMAKRIALVTGKSESEILALKTKDNTWKDVLQNLGVTPQQFKQMAREKIKEQIKDRKAQRKKNS